MRIWMASAALMLGLLPAGAPGGSLTNLSDDARELRYVFNKTKGTVRMMLIVSPT